MENSFDYIELGSEEEFAWSFDSPSHFFDWLVSIHEEFELVDTSSLKQAFLNQQRDYYYMECIKFEELYLHNE